MRGYMNGGLDDRYMILDRETGKECNPAKRFVLNYSYDPHAQKALLVYAESVRQVNPTLSSELEAAIVRATQTDEGFGPRDAYELREFLNVLPVDHYIDLARDSWADERLAEDCIRPTLIKNENGDVIAAIILEYDAGVPASREGPGEPGHCYWRFMTHDEIEQHFHGGE